jgi:hypothetical protein
MPPLRGEPRICRQGYLALGRCDLVNQGAWDREPLLAGILDGHLGHKLGFVADDGVKVEVRIAGRVLFVGLGLWRTNGPRVFLPWTLLWIFRLRGGKHSVRSQFGALKSVGSK